MTIGATAQLLQEKIRDRTARVGIIGFVPLLRLEGLHLEARPESAAEAEYVVIVTGSQHLRL